MNASAIARDALTLVSEPLLLYAPAAATIANLLAAPERFVAGKPPTAIASPLISSLAIESKRIGASPEGSPQSPVLLSNGVAVIQARGFLMREYGILARFGLATSTVMLSQDIRALQQNSSVRSIVLICDSPGGLAMGCEECAQAIAAGRGQKPMRAIVTGVCASAMYYIAAAFDSITASPSSLVGSIGSVIMHVDHSEALKKAGLTVEMVQFGKHKTDGHPYAPLEGTARESVQEWIDAYGWQFVNSVAKHRGITPAAVRERYGDGKVYIGSDAQSHGLVDAVGTFQSVVANLASSHGSQATAQVGFRLDHRDQEILARAGLIPRKQIGRTSQSDCAAAIARYCQRVGRPIPHNQSQLEWAIREAFPEVAGWLGQRESLRL